MHSFFVIHKMCSLQFKWIRPVVKTKFVQQLKCWFCVNGRMLFSFKGSTKRGGRHRTAGCAYQMSEKFIKTPRCNEGETSWKRITRTALHWIAFDVSKRCKQHMARQTFQWMTVEEEFNGVYSRLCRHEWHSVDILSNHTCWRRNLAIIDNNWKFARTSIVCVNCTQYTDSE